MNDIVVDLNCDIVILYIWFEINIYGFFYDEF